MKKINLFSGIAVVALVLGMSVTSCTTTTAPDPNAGKTDPSTIATADLVAYFPFNGNGKDSITGMTPASSGNVTYASARRKAGFKGNNVGYLMYNLPATSKLRTLKAFSVAMWLNEPQIPGEQADVPMILQITDDDNFWGNLTLTQDRIGTLAAPVDSLALKAYFYCKTATWKDQFIPIPNPAIKAAKWMHFIYQYDNVTSTFTVYVNGAKLTGAGPTSWAPRYSDAKPATGVQPPLGDMGFNKPSNLILGGGWRQKIIQTPAATDAWMGWFNGSMDELRIYDRALTDTEAKALYDAEVTQLN
jgi:hypothetical protein